MITEKQMDLTRHVEGAVAAAILKEWRETKQDYVISFPGVTVFPLEGVPLCEPAPVDEGGYGVIFGCAVDGPTLSGRFSEGEAQAVAKTFEEGAEPHEFLRGMVREMLDTMNQDVFDKAE